MSPRNGMTSVLLAGVGGQGVLFISELLALAAIEAGHDAKQTEIHGVSQRGGSVHSHIRFGAKVYSPLVPMGEADIVVGLEKLEAFRFAPYAGTQGRVMLDDQEIMPISAGDAAAAYPHDATSRMSDQGCAVEVVPATELASSEFGEKRVANVLLLGAVAARLPLPRSAWEAVMNRRIPEPYRELNRRAFAFGFDWSESPPAGAAGVGGGVA